jgi:hypothetical protein
MQRTGTMIFADDSQNDFDLISYGKTSASSSNLVLWFKDGDALVDHLKWKRFGRRTFLQRAATAPS